MKALKIFNSKYEMEPRLMLMALGIPSRPLSEDRFVALDFMTVYCGEFCQDTENLHGNSGFKYSEISARKQTVHAAIKSLVLEGLLTVELEDGFEFKPSEIGLRYAASFDSSYAKRYRRCFSAIYEKYSGLNETELFQIIQSKAVPDTEEDGLCTT